MSVTEDMLSNYGDFDENSPNNIIAPDSNIIEDDNNDLHDLIRHSFYYSNEQILSHLREKAKFLNLKYEYSFFKYKIWSTKNICTIIENP